MFYEGEDENKNENFQVSQNNNLTDKESDREVSDFLPSKDSCDQWLPYKLRN